MERQHALPQIAPLDPPWASARRSRYRRRRWWIARVPWTVYGYLTGEVVRVFLLGVIAVSLLYTTMAAYQTVRSGLQLTFLWPLLVKTFAYPLYFSIPLALLFGVTLVVGRMVHELEINALHTHGMSHAHIFAPLLGLGGVLAVACFYLNGWVVPAVHFQKRNIQSYILDQLQNLGSGVNRTILLEDDGGTLWVGAYRGSELRKVRVDLVTRKEATFLPAIRGHLPEQLPSRVRIYASEGTLDVLPEQKAVVLNLRSVQVLVPERAGADVFHQTVTVTNSVRVPLSFELKSPGTKDRSFPDLLAHIAALEDERGHFEGDRAPELEDGDAAIAFAAYTESGKSPGEWRQSLDRRLASARTELARRFAFVLSCLSFPLLGVSLSLLLHRSGRLVPFFIGNLVVIGLYYPLLMVAVSVGEAGFVPSLALLLPNAALLALGIHLTRKVVRR